MRKFIVLMAAMFGFIAVAMAMPVTVSMYSDSTCTNFFGYAHSTASVRYYMMIGEVGSYRVMTGHTPGCRFCRNSPPVGGGDECWEEVSY